MSDVAEPTGRRAVLTAADVQKARGMVLGGLLAGLAAGAGMELFAACQSAYAGQGFGLPPRLTAAAWLGVDAMVGGTAVVVLGAAARLCGTALCGLLFAAAGGSQLTFRRALVAGAVFGAAIWAAITFFGLQAVDPTLYDRVLLDPFAWFTQHLVFGGLLAFTPRLCRMCSA